MEKYKETAFLLLGGNVGDVEKTFSVVRSQLLASGHEIEAVSKVYRTQAWGMEKDTADFLNQVLKISTNQSAQDLLRMVLNIEKDLGRQRPKIPKVYFDRSIDIDILSYGTLIINDINLQIPHPRISERLFVLEPLNELAPKMILPGQNLTVRQLLSQCADKLKVQSLDD